MDIGINILENLRISIGESRDDLINDLENNNIKYDIAYGKNARIVMFIESYGVELETDNHNVTYIKSSNSELNYIMHIHKNSPFDTLIEIRDKLAIKFNINKDKIRIDRFEAKSFKSIMTIPYNEHSQVKISLIPGVNNGIYIEAMQLLNMHR